MKKLVRFCIGLAIVWLFGISQSLIAQVLLYDNFVYPAGEALTDHNWIQQQTTTTFPLAVAADGLTYPGYVGSAIGNSVLLGVEGQDVFRGFTKQTLAGDLYLAFMAKVTSATTAGDYFIAFKESPTSATNANYRGRVWVKSDGTNNIAFGITKGAVTTPIVPNYTALSYALNTTYLIVVKYIRIDGDPNDSVKLFVNPVTTSPEPAAAAINPDITSGTDLTGLGSVLLRQGTNGSSPTVVVDGIRVSTTWQSALNASNVSTLSDLKVDGTTVSGFSPTIYTYNDTVPAGQASVTLASTPTDWTATTNTSVAASVPGVSTIVVTAENGTSSSIYTVTHAYNYFMVSTSVAPAASGAISGGGVVAGGLPTTLTASPNAGYIFENWTENGNILGTDPQLVIPVVSSDHNIVGHFIQSSNTFTVTATPNPVDGGTITGSGNVTAGGSITLTATENPQFAFINWSENGNILGTDLSLTLTNVQANHSILGNFRSTVGIADQKPAEVVVYSSPSLGIITIKSSTPVTRFEVIGMDGRIIHSQSVNSENFQLSTAGYTGGTYIFRIMTSDKIFTKKVVIIK